MSLTNNFLRQHDEILAIAEQIASKLTVTDLQMNSNEVVAMLTQLAGRLNAHLTMEDNVLYPKLLAHPDQKIKSTAASFINEMGSLKEVFKNYTAKWMDSRNIQAEAPKFIDETTALFSALGQRIDKENNILYPMAAS